MWVKMAWLPQILNASLVLLVLGLGALLIDFIIPPTVKKTIDDCIETISLRLSYVVTIDWLRGWLRATRRAKIVDVVFGILEVLTFLVFVVVLSVDFFEDHPFLAIPGGLIVGAIATEAAWFPVDIALKEIGKPMMQTLSECDSLGEFTFHYFGAMIVGLIVLACGLGLTFLIGGMISPGLARIFGFWFGSMLTLWFLFLSTGY